MAKRRKPEDETYTTNERYTKARRFSDAAGLQTRTWVFMSCVLVGAITLGLAQLDAPANAYAIPGAMFIALMWAATSEKFK